jgi:hypothetical protein
VLTLKEADVRDGRRSLPRRAPAYIALILVLVAGAAVGGYYAFRGSTSHALRLPGHPDAGVNAGVIMQNVPLRTPYVYIAAPVCVTSGSAQITSITAVDRQGSFQVLDWAVQSPENSQPPSHVPIDGIPGTAAGLAGYNHDPVTSKCSDSYGITQVAVTVQITSSAAAANGLMIHYRADGDSGTVLEPFTITECTTAKCPHLAFNAPKGDT